VLTGRDVICLSSIDWDAHWQIHHQLVSSLVDADNRVLFIENTGVRAPGVRDLSRIRQRARNWWHSTKGFREVRPNLFVYSPLFLPFPYSSPARWFNRTVMFRGLRRWMDATTFRRPIVLTFLPTPLAHDLIGEVDPSVVVYYCADDFAATSAAARRVAPSEEAMFRRADLVFVTSQRLFEKARRWSEHVHTFPAGVDFAKFEAVRQSSSSPPPEFASWRRPIVGYVGGLHPYVDQPLLAAAADAMPEATFVLVGPAQVDVSLLAARPNVVLAGARPHDQVPAYVKAFDVALVPYLRSEFTESVYPVKLNEYLAMGVPVVATELPEVRSFNDRHDGVLQVASDTPSFIEAIRHSMDNGSADLREKRVTVARANSWGQRLGEMSALINEALQRRSRDERTWQQRLKRLYDRARRRTLQGVAAVVLLYAVLFYTPLVWWLASPLQLSEPPRRADAIVVFAGGVGESGEAGGGYLERVKQAVDLYQAGYANRVVISSGFVYAFREAEVMQGLAIANGVPPEAIELELKAKNTYENVRYVHEILASRGWSSVLLVSAPYHMRRALGVWAHVAPDVRVVPVPVGNSQFYAHTSGASLHQIRGIAHEYAAIVAYWYRGWL
jgi:uncharacterized SAM-binding protein YcdF (DUF218 family)/glycosyltransferase involved in cell wall biosynthesis